MDVLTFVDEGLGHASFLVDLDDGRALVVDPPRFPTEHREAAASRALDIVWTADTHSHADYVSGSPELAAEGATFLASKGAQLLPAHRPLVPGEELELTPGVTLRAIATPGHTPDHLSYLLSERARPVALFSGGSLMVGTVGRTDLLGDDRRDELARSLFRSLRDEILTLPDDLAVYPTHGAGSFCSAPAGAARTTTIGHERATNPLLAVSDEDTFVKHLSKFGSFPSYFRRLPEVNRRGAHIYGELPALARLDIDDVRRLIDDGALVVDARSIERYAAGHIPGALSIELRDVFGSWLGWLVDPDRPLVFVLDTDQDPAEIVRQCLDVGCEVLAGLLDGGMEAWRTAALPEAGARFVEPEQIAGSIVDVRQREEYHAGHVPGALNIELGALAAASLPDAPFTVMCGHGERALTAAGILEQRSIDDVRVVAGGPDDWAAATGCLLERDT